MEKYRVQSGDIDVEITASTHRMAAMKAIEQHIPCSLGRIITVLKDVDDESEEIYFGTKQVLEDMGF